MRGKFLNEENLVTPGKISSIMLLHKLFDCISLLTTDDTLHQWMLQFAVHRIPQKKQNNFSDLADKGMEEALNIIESSGWTVENTSDEDILSSKSIPEIGKVFKYEGIVNVEAEKINEKLFYNVEKSSEWNNNIEQVNVVQTIDNQTNVVRIISKNRYFVSSRDFVHLRKWKKKDDAIVHSTFSINHPEVPPDSSFIRGEHRFCTYVMRPLKDDPTKTHLTWLMQVSLNGWLPQHVTDHAVSFGMTNHLQDIRAFQNP